MSWLNLNIEELFHDPLVLGFVNRNGLTMKYNEGAILIYNSKILIKFYEELGGFYADFYDLVKLQWSRDLDNFFIMDNPGISAKEIFSKKLALIKENGKLSKFTIAACYAKLEVIELFMCEILTGNFSNYQEMFQPISIESQLMEIKRLTSGRGE